MAPSSTQAHYPTQDKVLLLDFEGLGTRGIADVAGQGAAQGFAPHDGGLCVGAGGSPQVLFSPRSWFPPELILDSLLN